MWSKWYMNEERRLIEKAVKTFAEKEVRPFISAMEDEDKSPKELVLALTKLGFLGYTIPEEKGGSGIDWVNYGIVIEELGKVSGNMAFISLLQGEVFAGFMASLANEQQIEKFLKPALRGEYLLGGWVTEPGGINDLASFETKAQLDGDEWGINGGKIFATNADCMDLAIVACGPVDEAPSADNIRYIIVPKDAAGFIPGHIENKIGFNGSRTGQIYLNDVRVPKENDLGLGTELFNYHMFLGYCGYAAAMLGGMETVFEQTVGYLKQRMSAGKSLWESHETIRFDIGKLWQAIDTYRNSLYGALVGMNNGTDMYLSMIALKHDGEKLMEHVCSECMSLYGGLGLVKETGIERFYRDVKMYSMVCGSTKTLTGLISAQL